MLLNTPCLLTAILTFSLCSSLSVNAASNDARIGFFSKDSTDDGETRLRLRLAHKKILDNLWSTKIRLAGRYSNDNSNKFHFELFQKIPANDGLRRGDTTLDELYIQAKNATNQLRIGRQQTKMELTGVAKKSLDRNTSPNTDITWTDGVYWLHNYGDGITSHAIIQYNTKSGTTEVRRSPLNFLNNGSRISAMFAIEKTSKTNFIIQRGFNISYLPDALHTNGVNLGKTENYITFTAKLATQWLLSQDTKFVIAAEIGYAPNTPDKSVFDLGLTGQTKGIAWQTSFNLINFKPQHSIGLVLATTEAGWLISPDFRNNNFLAELRYRWTISKNIKIEARTRRREEIKKPTASLNKRVDIDSYFRLTWKF